MYIIYNQDKHQDTSDLELSDSDDTNNYKEMPPWKTCMYMTTIYDLVHYITCMQIEKRREDGQRTEDPTGTKDVCFDIATV